jgi:hypothetical protein
VRLATEMKATTSGFAIFRRPLHNYDSQARGAFRKTLLRVGDNCYGGIDRIPWFDFDEDHYSHTLPREMEEIWDVLKNNKHPSADLRITADYSIALKVLNYVGKHTT